MRVKEIAFFYHELGKFTQNLKFFYNLDLPRRGRGRGAATGTSEILKFDDEYDFEQANAEFQELENKLAKNKIGKFNFLVDLNYTV